MESRRSTLAVVSNSSEFVYLLQRYAERIGCSLMSVPPSGLAKMIYASGPVAVIFSSIEILEASQSLVGELTNRDIPILVCSSAIDEIRSRELGADYCLLHPLTYDNFQAALAHVAAQKRI